MESTLRDHLSADWAFGVKGAIETIVRREYPSLLRQWPILQGFNFEAYIVGAKHFVIVLRDKLSGVPSGPGELKEFPYHDHPGLPPSTQNITEWLEYLVAKFALRPEDIALILPIHDSGKNDASADFALFSPVEAQLWNYQLSAGVARQKTTLHAPVVDTPNQPQHITYNINGTNSRVNINSNDSSVNISNESPPELFANLISAIRESSVDKVEMEEIASAVENMASSYGGDSFSSAYTKFMGLLADHIQVLGPVIAPFLPALAQLVF